MKIFRGTVDFDKLMVVAQFQVGPEAMFSWNLTTKDGDHPRAFYVGPDQNNQSRLSAVSSATTVQNLVLDALEEARADPGAYKPLSNIDLRYRYQIPLTGNTNPDEHPVYLEFGGTPMDFPVTDEKVKPPTPLLDFVRKTTLAEQTGNDELFASSFTPKSQDKVRRWLASESHRKQANSLPRPTASPTNVKFVLNADPVFLVFKTAIAGTNWTPANLTYTYVIHQDGSFRIANFAFSSDFEIFLADPTLFDTQFLKPVATRP